MTALRATIVSKTTIDDGRGMISDNAARTSPEEFQTTTPIPTTSKSSKIAPSKLVFRVLRSGGFQIVCFGGCLMTDCHGAAEIPEGTAVPGPRVYPAASLPP